MRSTTLSLPALLLCTLVACGGQPSSAPGTPMPEPASYEVHGEVMRLPSAERPEILLKHEAVPGFRDESGKVVGMDAMTMPFSLAPGVSLDGIDYGDPVIFTLEVRWSDDHQPVRISRILKSDLIRTIDLEDGKLPDQPVETPK